MSSVKLRNIAVSGRAFGELYHLSLNLHSRYLSPQGFRSALLICRETSCELLQRMVSGR